MQCVDIDDLTYSGEGIYELDGIPFTGVAVELGADGVVISETTYKQGQLFGRSREWHPNGRLILEVVYGGVEDRNYLREWYAGGQAKAEEVTQLGKLLLRREWSGDGKLMREFIDPSYKEEKDS